MLPGSTGRFSITIWHLAFYLVPGTGTLWHVHTRLIIKQAFSTTQQAMQQSMMTYWYNRTARIIEYLVLARLSSRSGGVVGLTYQRKLQADNKTHWKQDMSTFKYHVLVLLKQKLRVLWYGLGRPVITSDIGNWSVFVLLGWHFVVRVIMK